jgi:FKBP-type peptidyl-prolyl cis-trans isomerase
MNSDYCFQIVSDSHHCIDRELPKVGQLVRVDFDAFLSNGQALDRVFDMKFRVGQKWVIPGLEIAVRKMKVGQTASFRVSPELAFGTMGIPGVVDGDQWIFFYLKLSEICW